MRVVLEPLHMSALRWKDSPSSADIPEHTTIKNRSKRTRGCPPYVISGIRGVTGGERPEVFDVLSPRNRVGINKEALNGNKKSPMEGGVSLSRDEIQQIYSTQSEISELERESRYQGASSRGTVIVLESRIVWAHVFGGYRGR